MGSIAASVVIDRAAIQLHDPDHVRWEESELLGWLNEGQNAIASVRPEAKTVTGDLQLVAGTKQEIPASGVRLHEVVRNRGATTVADGDAITLVDKSLLDSFSPGWHQASTAQAVQHYCHSADDPRLFYVYPPQPSNSPGIVEISYTAIPDDLTSVAEPIEIDDIFQGPLLDYVLYRAYSKDSDYAGADRLAAGHYQAFFNALGIKATADMAVAPTSKAPPHAPTETERR